MRRSVQEGGSSRVMIAGSQTITCSEGRGKRALRGAASLLGHKTCVAYST